MLNKQLVFGILCFISLSFSSAQVENDTTSISIDKEPVLIDNTLIERQEIDPLRPSKAAFYSAILPGGGQFYNKKYWKIPIVWGAIGTGVYFYLRNDKQFDRYRDAYKRRLAGFTDDEFFGFISDDGLIRAQQQFRRNKEVSL